MSRRVLWYICYHIKKAAFVDGRSSKDNSFSCVPEVSCVLCCSMFVYILDSVYIFVLVLEGI